MTGGRHIDPELGELRGEAASQANAAAPASGDPWPRVPSDRGGDATPTYYDTPMLKEPVWIWAVPVYFHVGGAAGTAAVVGAAAQLVGGDDMRGLVRASRRLTLAGVVVGSGLLVHDLGRPERFLNMLRVFRPTSVLNVGSWILAATGAFAAAGTTFAGARGARRRAGDAAGLAAGLLGIPLSGYTAVLLSTTAVPLWKSLSRSLPILFVSSAAAAGAATLGAVPLTEREAGAVRRFGLVAGLAEVAAMSVVERDAFAVEVVGRPLRSGVGASLWRGARALGVASLATGLLRRRSRTARLLHLPVTTAGGLSLRFAVFYAGKASARDPRATFRT